MKGYVELELTNTPKQKLYKTYINVSCIDEFKDIDKDVFKYVFYANNVKMCNTIMSLKHSKCEAYCIQTVEEIKQRIKRSQRNWLQRLMNM